MMENGFYFSPIVQLYDKETWVQMTNPQTREPLEFQTEKECRDYVEATYNGYTRFDVFHGLQKILIAKVTRKGSR